MQILIGFLFVGFFPLTVAWNLVSTGCPTKADSSSAQKSFLWSHCLLYPASFRIFLRLDLCFSLLLENIFPLNFQLSFSSVCWRNTEVFPPDITDLMFCKFITFSSPGLIFNLWLLSIFLSRIVYLLHSVEQETTPKLWHPLLYPCLCFLPPGFYYFISASIRSLLTISNGNECSQLYLSAINIFKHMYELFSLY